MNLEVIQVHAEFAVSVGKFDSFKAVGQEMIDTVGGKEPDTLSYEWYFNGDNSKCYTMECYRDAAALSTHLSDVNQFIHKLLDVSKITKLDVFGKLTPELEKRYVALGAQNFRYWNGVTRKN